MFLTDEWQTAEEGLGASREIGSYFTNGPFRKIRMLAFDSYLTIAK